MNLFVFGLGYTASHFVRDYRTAFDRVAGTVRAPKGAVAPDLPHVSLFGFDSGKGDPRIVDAIGTSEALLVSVQPGDTTDPVLAGYAQVIAESSRLRSIVYLSTIGVYGDHGGDWIDETAALRPDNQRQSARVEAEQAWIDLGARTGKSAVVLRLAGIYGPGRNALDDLRSGTARRIDKPGQVFNRIHVADISASIAAALRQEDRQVFVNVTDDEPAPAPDVVAYAARLMGRDPPSMIAFETAQLSPMARSFYSANRRVANTALKSDLGVRLAYPTYREGLDALWAAGEGRP